MFVDEIKAAKRISHNKLDTELQRIEDYACAELIRAGVPSNVITQGDKLIKNAVVTFALKELSDDKNFERYKVSWEYQLDCLRKKKWGTSNV